MIIDSLEQLRLEYKKVNPKDPSSLRAWFDAYPYLSVTDHALIMEKCTTWVRKLRKLAGIKGHTPITKVRNNDLALVVGTVPDDWRNNPAWLEENINKYGVSAVARSTNSSLSIIHFLMRKHKIKGLSLKSKNPNCNKAWCHKHYVELQYTLEECAKYAGISKSKFEDWLVKFKIPVRPNHVRLDYNRQLKFEFKTMLNKLKMDPAVKKIRVGKNRLLVTHIDNLRSQYIFSQMNAEDWQFTAAPPILNKYETDVLGGDDTHLYISRTSLNNASVIERNVALHLFNHLIIKRGWIWPKFPEHEILEDYNKLKSANINRCFNGESFMLWKTYGHGKKLLQHFFDMSDVYSCIFQKNRSSWKVVYDLVKRTAFSIDYANIIRHAIVHSSRKLKFRLYGPMIYSTIFNKLGVKGKILDLRPGYGSKALAASLNNIVYYHKNDRLFNQAVELGFTQIVPLEHYIYDDNNIDWVIADRDFTGDQCEELILEAFSHANRAKRILAYIPASHKEELYNKYKPAHIVRIITVPKPLKENYIFIW